MEEDIKREEHADKVITYREAFVAMGSVMEEDQPGQAPPKALEKGKGPPDAADNDRTKAMTPLPNPVQQQQELNAAAAKITPADRVMYGNLLVEPMTMDHIWNVVH